MFSIIYELEIKHSEINDSGLKVEWKFNSNKELKEIRHIIIKANKVNEEENGIEFEKIYKTLNYLDVYTCEEVT